MKYNFTIKPITKEEAIDMIQTYHYSNTLPKINKYFLGCFLKDKLVGCVPSDMVLGHYILYNAYSII